MASDLGLWLRGQRQTRGWSAAEMARRLQKAARLSGDNAAPGGAVLASYVRRWERGTIGPTERYLLHYCKAFGIAPDDFGPDLLDHGQTSAGRAGIWSQAEPAGEPDARNPCSSVKAPGYGEDRRNREAADRPVPAPGVRAAPRSLVTVIAEESQDFGEWVDTSNVGDSTLEQYAAQVRLLARDYEHEPPYPLLLDARRLRDRVFTRLQGHQRPGQTRELYLIAAQVCGLLAWMSGDMSFYRAAATQAWTAWVCAEQADHDGTRAWVRATQSKLAYWDARYLESEQLAEDGLSYADAGSAQIMLGLFRARALARLGRSDEAADSLSGAAAGMAAEDPEHIGGVWGVTAARYHGLAANAHLRRHEPRQALAEAGEALDLFEAADPRERNYGAEAHTRIDLAHARLMLRDLDGAESALRPVLALSPECRYEPITQELLHVRQALADRVPDAAIARALQEEIETYSRESIANESGD